MAKGSGVAALIATANRSLKQTATKAMSSPQDEMRHEGMAR